MDLFDNINIDALQPLQDIFSDGWFDDFRQIYGEGLSDEIISQSVQETCDFFHIEEPAIVSEGWTTGVYPNNDFTLQDDVSVFNREQLLDMGISGKDGLDLVMTHEGTHRMLQGMEHLDFDAHHEELCCDYMAGVRAGLNNIDVYQMENALLYTPESESHPAGTERVESIEAGVRFAKEYFAEYNMAPTFNECLDSFCEMNEIEQNEPITISNESAPSNLNVHCYAESTKIVAKEDSDTVENNPTFKGYTQAEINSKKKVAESNMNYWKGEMRSHGELAKHEMWRESEMAHVKNAERNYEKAKSEYNKWSNMKPDKSQPRPK